VNHGTVTVVKWKHNGQPVLHTSTVPLQKRLSSPLWKSTFW